MTEAQRILLAESAAIQSSYDLLKRHGIPHAESARAWRGMEEVARRTYDLEDVAWPKVESDSIDEHLKARRDLSCALEVGRAYRLSTAQRDVIRERYSMTPAQTVKVTDLALYEGTQYIRHVTLKSEEHVDPRRRAVMTSFTIDRWGNFCKAVKAREEEIAMQRELDRFTQRIDTLLVKAKEEGTIHRQRSAGNLANRLHVEVLADRVSDHQEIRNRLRKILLSMGETGLAALVKEPRFFDLSEESKKRAKEQVKGLTALIAEYGV